MFNAMPNPLLLNKLCLNQEDNIKKPHICHYKITQRFHIRSFAITGKQYIGNGESLTFLTAIVWRNNEQWAAMEYQYIKEQVS